MTTAPTPYRIPSRYYAPKLTKGLVCGPQYIRIYALWKAGMTYPELKEETGYSVEYCRNIVWNVARALHQGRTEIFKITDPVRQQRTERRLEKLAQLSEASA